MVVERDFFRKNDSRRPSSPPWNLDVITKVNQSSLALQKETCNEFETDRKGKEKINPREAKIATGKD